MDPKKKPATPAGNGSPSTMGEKPAGGSPGKPPPGTSAASSVPAFGGNRGGRAREDGLPPGSSEAEEADRKKDRERKRLARKEAAEVAEPAPLPSAVAPEPGPGPAPAAVLSSGAPGPEAPPVPWQPETLSGLVDELIEAAEENRVGSYIARCAEAGLAPKLAKEIENDARFPKMAKALLKSSVPRLAAKWLNKTGISAEYQDEVAVLTAIILIVKQGSSLNSRFEEIILQNKTPKPVEVKKP